MTAGSNEAQETTWKERLDDEIHWLLHEATLRQAIDYYYILINEAKAGDEVLAHLGKHDRFFLLTHLCSRADAVHPWIYDRCREVERNTDGYIDLWARDHYKSTIITFAGSIQEILKDPEITIGIFSHTRPIAKAFASQIKSELEFNETLKRLYPDILWDNPRKEAPVWSLDNGFVVKRDSNPKEKTVEAWGLVDGQPVSKHYRLLIFDDVVVMASVTNPDQILKTTDHWELAQNLGSSQNPRDWHVGTRYNFADTWGQMIKRKARIPRIYPATKDGSVDGETVFLSLKVWENKKRESSMATIACQQLLNPLAGSEQEMLPEWVRPYELRPLTLNVYILGDYAGSRAGGSSNTAFAVIGVDANLNKYLLDGAVHKMNLDDRWKMLKHLRKKWVRAPGVQIVQVGYERYGAQSDIQHFETMMRIEGESFPIEEVNYPGGDRADHIKDNRIRRLIPDHKNWRFFYPYKGDVTKAQHKAIQDGQEFLLAKPIKQRNQDGMIYDIVDHLVNNELLFFPATTLKDMLDAMSRIYDMQVEPPMVYSEADLLPEVPDD